jgi:hypothetical protein
VVESCNKTYLNHYFTKSAKSLHKLVLSHIPIIHRVLRVFLDGKTHIKYCDIK